MVTDSNSFYSSPAGKEYTLAAGRIAGINPGSRVCDLGCGYGQAACHLAAEFRCRTRAIDKRKEHIAFARTLAENNKVSHLIRFECADILEMDFHDTTYDLIMAEGGLLSSVNRSRGCRLAASLCEKRGWFAFSDLVFCTDRIPEEIRDIFDDKRYGYESEATYRKLLADAGFTVHLMTLVPRSGWDNYYAHMASRLEDTSGLYADQQVKLTFHREIDAFYRLEAFQYVGYLFGIARKTG